jgi:hypothetical protein
MLDRELRFQVIKLPTTALDNGFAGGIRTRKVRIPSCDFSPETEKHPRVQDNHRSQKCDKK